MGAFEYGQRRSATVLGIHSNCLSYWRFDSGLTNYLVSQFRASTASVRESTPFPAHRHCVGDFYVISKGWCAVQGTLRLESTNRRVPTFALWVSSNSLKHREARGLAVTSTDTDWSCSLSFASSLLSLFFDWNLNIMRKIRRFSKHRYIIILLVV